MKTIVNCNNDDCMYNKDYQCTCDIVEIDIDGECYTKEEKDDE